MDNKFSRRKNLWKVPFEVDKACISVVSAGQDEEVVMHPTDHPKVGELEHFVHDPHNLHINIICDMRMTFAMMITLEACHNLVAKADSWRENGHKEGHICCWLKNQEKKLQKWKFKIWFHMEGWIISPHLVVGHQQKVLMFQLGRWKFWSQSCHFQKHLIHSFSRFR